MLYDLKHKKVADTNKEGEWALFKLIETFKVKEKSKSLIEFEYKKDRYLASMYLKGSMARMFTRRNPLKSFRLSGNL